MRPTRVPHLDELAGEWQEAQTLLNRPAVNNFHGGIQVARDLLGFSHLTFAPVSQCGSKPAAILSIDGAPVFSDRSRWYPYQVLRETRRDGLELRSATRMTVEDCAILLSVDITNRGTRPVTPELQVDLHIRPRVFPGVWDWATPRDFEGPVQVRTEDRIVVVTDPETSASACFAGDWDRLSVDGEDPTGVWNLNLDPGESRSIQVVVSMATDARRALEAIRRHHTDFHAAFASAKGDWEARYAAAFDPADPFFSGTLPTLTTDRPELDRLYYLSVVSVLQLVRTNLPLFRRVYTTCGPQWAVTSTYFWDISLLGYVFALLDPSEARAQILYWLGLDLREGYAVDGLTGSIVGPWYAANDLAVVTAAIRYVDITGDVTLLQEEVDGRTALRRLGQIATAWRDMAIDESGLADYGDVWSLLEEVPNYVGAVPALNAGNVWMMRQVARMERLVGDSSVAEVFEQWAEELAKRVLAQYEVGTGAWRSRHRDGSEALVKHIYDFDMIGTLLADDLDMRTKREMRDFLVEEMVAGDWLRALSLEDPDAGHSQRPDHGANGAYDAWVALAGEALASLGFGADALGVLSRSAKAGEEGALSQSHFAAPAPEGLIVNDSPATGGSNEFGVAVWIRPSSLPAHLAESSVLAKQAWDRGATGYWVGIDARGRISTQLGTSEGYVDLVTEEGLVERDRWTHIAVSFADRDFSLYVDGNLALAARVDGFVPALSEPLLVGMHGMDPARRFRGQIALLRATRGALSQDEVRSMATERPAPLDTWQPNDGSNPDSESFGDNVRALGGRITRSNLGHVLLIGDSDDLIPRLAYWFGQAANEQASGAFASVLLNVFGLSPRVGELTSSSPLISGVSGEIVGISVGGKMTSIAFGVQKRVQALEGVSQDERTTDAVHS